MKDHLKDNDEGNTEKSSARRLIKFCAG